MSTWCRGSRQTVAFTREDVSETSRFTGRPSRARVKCPVCRRPGLPGRVCLVQIALGADDGIATVPHHYRRGDSDE